MINNRARKWWLALCEQDRRWTLLRDYAKSNDGRDLSGKRRKQLGDVLATSVGAKVRTFEQLRVLRAAIEAVDQLARKPARVGRAKAVPA